MTRGYVNEVMTIFPGTFTAQDPSTFLYSLLPMCIVRELNVISGMEPTQVYQSPPTTLQGACSLPFKVLKDKKKSARSGWRTCGDWTTLRVAVQLWVPDWTPPATVASLLGCILPGRLHNQVGITVLLLVIHPNCPRLCYLSALHLI